MLVVGVGTRGRSALFCGRRVEHGRQCRRSGANYHCDPIVALLRQLGWSLQCPIFRASQRNEAAILTELGVRLVAQVAGRVQFKVLRTGTDTAERGGAN